MQSMVSTLLRMQEGPKGNSLYKPAQWQMRAMVCLFSSWDRGVLHPDGLEKHLYAEEAGVESLQVACRPGCHFPAYSSVLTW